MDIQPGDFALLCADGLSGEVSDDELRAILSTRASARKMVETLVHAALPQEASDNVRCVVVRRRA